jgi:hypothetical protein
MLGFGTRVRIKGGPHAGELGKVTSVLSGRGEAYYQVQLVTPEQGSRPAISVGLFRAEQLEVIGEQA